VNKRQEERLEDGSGENAQGDRGLTRAVIRRAAKQSASDPSLLSRSSNSPKTPHQTTLLPQPGPQLFIFSNDMELNIVLQVYLAK
jgi:hypothetical protein